MLPKAAAGFIYMPFLVDADDDEILGLIHGQFLSRSDRRKPERHRLPIDQKERYRWLQGADVAARVCATARQLTVVADREADIFEAFARRPASVDLLVRAAQDRSLEDGGRLFAHSDAQAVLARAI